MVFLRENHLNDVFSLSHYPIRKHRFLSSSPIFSTQPMLSHINHFSVPDSRPRSWLESPRSAKVSVETSQRRDQSRPWHAGLGQRRKDCRDFSRDFMRKITSMKQYETEENHEISYMWYFQIFPVWNPDHLWIYVIFPNISSKPRSFQLCCTNRCNLSRIDVTTNKPIKFRRHSGDLQLDWF